MSSLSPLGPSPTHAAGLEPVTAMSPPPAPYLGGTLEGVSSLLAMAPGDVRGALKQGSSLADLAAGRGVGRDALVHYLTSQVETRRAAQGKAAINPQVLATVVGTAVDRRRGQSQSLAPAASASTPPGTLTTGAGDPLPVDLLALSLIHI